MKPYKQKLMEAEFGFLGDVAAELRITLSNVDEVKVQKADQLLMTMVGQEKKYSWSGGGYHHYRIYFAVADDGSVTRLKTEGDYSEGSGYNYNWTAYDNGDQLIDLGLKPVFIIECVQQDTDANGNGRTSRRWIIHKMAGFDLKAYHLARLEEATTMLRQEIEAAFAA